MSGRDRIAAALGELLAVTLEEIGAALSRRLDKAPETARTYLQAPTVPVADVPDEESPWLTAQEAADLREAAKHPAEVRTDYGDSGHDPARPVTGAVPFESPCEVPACIGLLCHAGEHVDSLGNVLAIDLGSRPWAPGSPVGQDRGPTAAEVHQRLASLLPAPSEVGHGRPTVVGVNDHDRLAGYGRPGETITVAPFDPSLPVLLDADCPYCGRRRHTADQAAECLDLAEAEHDHMVQHAHDGHTEADQ